MVSGFTRFFYRVSKDIMTQEMCHSNRVSKAHFKKHTSLSCSAASVTCSSWAPINNWKIKIPREAWNASPNQTFIASIQPFWNSIQSCVMFRRFHWKENDTSNRACNWSDSSMVDTQCPSLPQLSQAWSLQNYLLQTICRLKTKVPKRGCDRILCHTISFTRSVFISLKFHKRCLFMKTCSFDDAHNEYTRIDIWYLFDPRQYQTKLKAHLCYLVRWWQLIKKLTSFISKSKDIFSFLGEHICCEKHSSTRKSFFSRSFSDGFLKFAGLVCFFTFFRETGASFVWSIGGRILARMQVSYLDFCGSLASSQHFDTALKLNHLHVHWWLWRVPFLWILRTFPIILAATAVLEHLGQVWLLSSIFFVVHSGFSHARCQQDNWISSNSSGVGSLFWLRYLNRKEGSCVLALGVSFCGRSDRGCDERVMFVFQLCWRIAISTRWDQSERCHKSFWIL